MMNVEAALRTTGYAIMGTAVVAYFSRPWSCSLVLSQFTPRDPVPYSHFDYHGWGVMLAWLASLLFAAPVLWLASKVFLSGVVKFRILGRARNAETTVRSGLIALGLGAPMYSQLAYLGGLPVSVTTPIWVTSLAWLLVVEVGRTAAVEGNLLEDGAVRVAAALAFLISLPKLALIWFALIGT